MLYRGNARVKRNHIRIRKHISIIIDEWMRARIVFINNIKQLNALFHVVLVFSDVPRFIATCHVQLGMYTSSDG